MSGGGNLRAGAAELDITPPLGLELCGYGPYEKRVATEVLDPLTARALWLEASGRSVVLICLDLVAVSAATRDAAAAALRDRCSVPDECVFAAASHTHSGPATARLIAWGERDAAYMARLAEAMVEVALSARDSLRPARIGACRQRVTGVGVNREQPDLGPLDTAAQLMRVDDAEGRPMAVVFNYGAHAVTRYPFTSRISADWPGLAAACLKHRTGGAVPLFLQGPCGNINGHDVLFGRADACLLQKVSDTHAGYVAEHFCSQVAPGLERIATSSMIELGARRRMVRLPCTALDEAALRRTIEEKRALAECRTLADLRPLHQRMADETPEESAWRWARYEFDAAAAQLEALRAGVTHVEAPIQVLRIGPAAIVGWPGEVFVELGIELRQRSPVPLTFVASFANDYVGYIPTPAAYESRGKPHEFGRYPTAVTPRIVGLPPFRSDVGAVLVEETLGMLGGL